MAISGYGATLAGSTTGAITGIERLSVGGLTLNFDEVATVGDTNRVAEHVPLGVVEGPITLTIKYVKAIYNSLRNALLAQTSETWTLTDSASSTHVGSGTVASVSDEELGTGGHSVFQCTIMPATKWVFTA
jgi:hypothetical protein